MRREPFVVSAVVLTAWSMAVAWGAAAAPMGTIGGGAVDSKAVEFFEFYDTGQVLAAIAEA